MKRLSLLILSALALSASAQTYKDDHVRFTLIDEGTIRLEYAPDGKFVDNKSFMAVVRDYADVPCQVKDTKKQLTITTSKLQLVYKKGSGPLTKQNLTITSGSALGQRFIWSPGTIQKGNLRGTYRTLDGYDGEFSRYERKPIPLEEGLLATDGWTLIDDSRSLVFDNDPDWPWVDTRTSAEGAQDWYFMAYGHDYKGALNSYTKFAGRIPLPPRYAFGYWWSRYWSYSDQDFRDLVRNFEEYDIPIDVLVIDMDWHPISEAAGGGWTGWDWNENIFPDYKQFLRFLDDKGVKATMNLHPADGVRPFEKKYQEFRQRIGMKDGETREWLGSDKQYVTALFDTYLHPYMDEGVDFWWLDWQQWLNDKKIPELSNTFWCNYIWFTDMERYGDKRPMLYHRWGGLGNHRYQVGFSGDSFITWESLAYLPYFNSTASNVLYGYWSHDIGGHQNVKWDTPVEPELYTRAMQMGQYLPIIRSHSTKNPYLNKEPWAFAQETTQRLKDVINGRYALVPYIYTMAREAYETGISLCRPMYYDYPEDKEAYDVRSQYMFGDDMMIAPVTAPVDKADGYARMNVWLPEGQWFEYETGQMLDGGQTIERAFTIDEYPVYIKAGAILPYYGKVKNLSGNDQPVIVRVFPGGEKGQFKMYEDNGEDNRYQDAFATTPLSYERDGQELTVIIGQRKGQYKDMPAKRHFTVALPCQGAPESVTVDGKRASFTYDGAAVEALIDLGEVSCAAGATVKVKFPADAPSLDGLRAKFHRIQKAVADYKQADCNMVYTPAFGYLEAAPLRLSYHPEKMNETVSQFNTYYADLPTVLMEQMVSEEPARRFCNLIDEKVNLRLETLSDDIFTSSGKTGFDVKFYNNLKLEGAPAATAHWEKLALDAAGEPATGIKRDGFSLSAEAVMNIAETTDLLFRVGGDDGYRLYIDGRLVIDAWKDQALTWTLGRFHAEGGRDYKVRVEFYDGVNEAQLFLQTMKKEK